MTTKELARHVMAERGLNSADAALLLISLYLTPIATKATSVIAYRTDAAVYIGADSKLTSPHSTIKRTGCKIGVSNEILWGESGIIGARGGFNTTNVINDIMNMSAPIDERISVLESSLVQSYHNIMMAIKAEDPAYFSIHYGHKGAALEISLAYMERGVPHLISIDFMAEPGGAGAVITPKEVRDPQIAILGIVLGRLWHPHGDRASYPN